MTFDEVPLKWAFSCMVNGNPNKVVLYKTGLKTACSIYLDHANHKCSHDVDLDQIHQIFEAFEQRPF
jgi:hypothetical protein